jgi:hypothetical protein
MITDRSTPASGRSRRLLNIIVGLQVIIFIVGCSKGEPKGQVIATIDGAELTLSELEAEARIRNLPIAANRTLRDALVTELVDRKLLVRAARARKLDATPEFILMQRRADEILLAQQLLATTAADAGTITDAEVARKMNAEPSPAEAGAVEPDRARLARVRSSIERDRLEAVMNALLIQEQKSAKIHYQKGFAPKEARP